MTARSGKPLVSIFALIDGYVLWRFPPSPGDLLRDLAAPHAWVARVGADGAIGTGAGVLLWLVALWLAIGLTATVIAAGTGGRPGVLTALSRRMTPALLRRLVIASTGASIAFGPVTAVAAGTAAAPPAATGSIAIGWPSDPSAAELPPPDWPLDQTTGPSGNRTSAASTTSAAFGTTGSGPGTPPTGQASAPPVAGTTTPAPPAAGTTTPAPPVAGTTTPAPPAAGTPPVPPLDPDPGHPAPSTVVVKPGDSLWLLTAQRLDPTATDGQIAVAWPEWYRRNRSVIGKDPNLLRPGQRLAVPASKGKA